MTVSQYDANNCVGQQGSMGLDGSATGTAATADGQFERENHRGMRYPRITGSPFLLAALLC